MLLRLSQRLQPSRRFGSYGGSRRRRSAAAAKLPTNRKHLAGNGLFREEDRPLPVPECPCGPWIRSGPEHRTILDYSAAAGLADEGSRYVSHLDCGSRLGIATERYRRGIRVTTHEGCFASDNLLCHQHSGSAWSQFS